MPARSIRPLNTRPPARGFTLVELMVVIAIIAMMIVMLTFALYAATETAKAAATRQTINKLHNQIMPRWEGYQTRRLPVDVNQTLTTKFRIKPSDTTTNYRLAVGCYRLAAMRELMREELPDTYWDLIYYWDPQFANGKNRALVNNAGALTLDLVETYKRRVCASQVPALSPSNASAITTAIMQSASGSNVGLATDHQSAEMLYMLILTGTDDHDLTAVSFTSQESGDFDFDGMPEFRDGWKNPIQFIRWPAGFASDLQPVVSVPKTDPLCNPAIQPADPAIGGNFLTFNPTLNHDTFDPLLIDSQTPPPKIQLVSQVYNLIMVDSQSSSQKTERGYQLLPLIMSYGPDGDGNTNEGFGIMIPKIANGSPGDVAWGDPYAFFAGNGGKYKRGAIMTGEAYDNIHNHLLGTRR